MAFGAVATLKFVWDFLSPVFGDLLKDKISLSMKSDKKAKALGFELYEQLERIQFCTNEFKSSLVDLANLSINDSPDKQQLEECKQLVRSKMEQVYLVLDRAREILEKMGIQMKIHLPDFLNNFYEYEQLRGVNLESVSKRIVAIDNFSKEDKADIQAIINTTMSNQVIIDSGIEKLRLFLAKEFSFKDSF